MRRAVDVADAPAFVTQSGPDLMRRSMDHGRDQQVSAENGRFTAQERFERVPEASLQFEPDTGNHRRFRGAGDDRHVVAVAAERLKAERIDLSATGTKPGRNMQTE
jgi:hypothetical protein